MKVFLWYNISMVTIRSRSKLERKAHMNIHDTLEVAEERTAYASYTRDRFGKSHEISFDEIH